jgi:AraC-like DNA-binding protein
MAFGDNVRFCESQTELLAASRAADVELVLVGLSGQRSDRSLTTTVAAIRASRRSPPVYVYGDRSIGSITQLMPLARAGAAGLILLDVDDDVVNLRRLIAPGMLVSASTAVTMALQQVVSPRHLPLFLFCIEHIADPPSASTFARQLRVSRRTLSAWARQAGARGIRSLTSKCRVLVALEMIRGSARSIEQVAHDLRFASSAHLHNTITRYTGRRPREALADDLVSWCQRLFTSATPRVASSENTAASRGMAGNSSPRQLAHHESGARVK